MSVSGGNQKQAFMYRRWGGLLLRGADSREQCLQGQNYVFKELKENTFVNPDCTHRTCFCGEDLAAVQVPWKDTRESAYQRERRWWDGVWRKHLAHTSVQLWHCLGC